MNVMINDISHDRRTTVHGVQVCITLFLPLNQGHPAPLRIEISPAADP